MSAGAWFTIRAGMPVFPCEPQGKAPLARLAPHGFKDATTDKATIARWRKRCPDANWAMPTGPASGNDVLDVDVRAEGNGRAAFERLKQAGLLRGGVRIVRTPSGGLHVYFPASGLASGRLPAHYLDFKAQGGYVLVPPSYVVVPPDPDAEPPHEGYEGPYVEEEARDPALGRPLDWEACKRFLDGPRARPRPPYRPAAGGDVARLADWLRRVPEGNRNSALYWAANRAVDRGQPPDALLDAALDAGLGQVEAERTIASARKGAPRWAST